LQLEKYYINRMKSTSFPPQPQYENHLGKLGSDALEPICIFCMVFTMVCVFMCQYSFAQRSGGITEAKRAMVVSASAEATKVGVAILRAGGNAVDAAVGVGFALAVTYPSAGNIGGGAYLLIRMADGREAAIDAREVAPHAATEFMYLDSCGNVINDKSLKGPLAAGVPGSVDGLLTALSLFGTKSHKDLMRPAIQLAINGFRLPSYLASFLTMMQSRFREFPTTRETFSPNQKTYRTGDRWKQPELGETLQRISDQGWEGFYKGKTADLFVTAMNDYGGIITKNDLASYHSIIRKPLHGEYRGYNILSFPPSSSGGLVLLEILNILEAFPLKELGFGTAMTTHLMVEAMKRAFADRSIYMGDPEFVTIPIEQLLSQSHAQEFRSSIYWQRATPSDSLMPGKPQLLEGNHTTHYSIVDKWGNAVSVTTTLNSVCGSKFVVPGTGFFLNNEMDDFSIKRGQPNQFGLTGSSANKIMPGKRMLSSMTPTIVTRDNRTHIIIGSPGGSRIITSVLQVLVNVIDYDMTIRDAVSRFRFHHQWLPDTIFYEAGYCTSSVLQQLGTMGHTYTLSDPIGRVEAIVYDPIHKVYRGCSDPRGHGLAAGY